MTFDIKHSYKYDEIKSYFDDFIADYSIDTNGTDDLHHHAFNSDYYIIGRWPATQWLGDEVFNIIDYIKEYEQDNFGEVYTDFSKPEIVVNMYAYIIGEHIVSEYIEELETEVA